MRVGLQLPSFSWPGSLAVIRPRLPEIARVAEDAGFASLWVMDHFFQLPARTGWGGPDEPMLEAYATIEKTSLVDLDLRPGRMSAREAVERLRGQAEEGIQHLIVNLPDPHDLHRLEAIGREVIPTLQGTHA